MGDSKISVRKRRSWSSVPDDVLQDLRLSLSARAVLGWMLGRPAGWDLHVSHVCRVLGITDKAWRRIRGELTKAGYLAMTRLRVASSSGRQGVFAWEITVTDEPVPAVAPRETSPSALFAGMENCMDADCTDARQADIAVSASSSTETNRVKSAPASPTRAQFARSPAASAPAPGLSSVLEDEINDADFLDQAEKDGVKQVLQQLHSDEEQAHFWGKLFWVAGAHGRRFDNPAGWLLAQIKRGRDRVAA